MPALWLGPLTSAGPASGTAPQPSPWDQELPRSHLHLQKLPAQSLAALKTCSLPCKGQEQVCEQNAFLVWFLELSKPMLSLSTRNTSLQLGARDWKMLLNYFGLGVQNLTSVPDDKVCLELFSPWH